MTHIPDFFIVGAPKCGTTSLATWLGEHPAIFMSPIKEPNYYCFDDPRRRVVTNAAAYSQLFDSAKHWQTCGEASTAYLFSDTAVPTILRENARANIIAMVRNPIDMAVSFHAQKIYNHREHVTDFEEAWRLSPKRNRWLDYQKLSRLGQQIARLKSWVPSGQLHVIVFDDIQTDPAAVYRDVCIFLGSRPEEDKSDFAVANTRREMKSSALGRFIRHPPWPGRLIKRAVLCLFPAHANAISRRLKLWNTRAAPRRPLSDRLRQEMIDFYRDDVSLLSKLLGRDLSHWLEPRCPM